MEFSLSGPQLRETIQELFLNIYLDSNRIEKLTRLEAPKCIVTTDEHFQPCYGMQKNVEIALSKQEVF